MKTDLHSSQRSAAKRNLANLLADLDREDLSTLLTVLVQRHPELYDWIEATMSDTTSTRKAKKAHNKKVDADAYRRQVIEILHSLDGMRCSEAYWHVRDLVQELRDVKESAIQLLKQGDVGAALDILVVMLEEISEGMEVIDDSDGYFSGFIAELADPLTKATRRATLTVFERERLVRRLAKVADYLKGYEMDDVVEDALNVASGKQNIATHDEHQHRKTKRKQK